MLLAKHFIATKSKGKALSLSAEAQSRLLAYRWPGNVRELQNVIERAVLLNPAGSTELDVAAFPELTPLPNSMAGIMHGGQPLSQQLEAAEKAAVAEALRQSAGNQSQAAKFLGLERTTLQYKMKKHGLS